MTHQNSYFGTIAKAGDFTSNFSSPLKIGTPVGIDSRPVGINLVHSAYAYMGDLRYYRHK